MLRGGYGLVGLADSAIRADQVADALGRPGVRCVAGAIGQADLPRRIAEEGKGVVEFLGEGGILLDCVKRDSQDLGIVRLKLCVEVAEPATFFRSTRSIRLRIEPHQNVLALVI